MMKGVCEGAPDCSVRELPGELINHSVFGVRTIIHYSPKVKIRQTHDASHSRPND
jgi:hypothetical protein